MTAPCLPPRPLRTCPHCGMEIPKLLPRPRDYGLLINLLIYRVPCRAELREAHVEAARLHCKMTEARLRELRDPSGPHARHWGKMLERRAARKRYLEEHGVEPEPWQAVFPGEHEHLVQLACAHDYRAGGLAKLKARTRRRTGAFDAADESRMLNLERERGKAKESALKEDMETRLIVEAGVALGTIRLGDYNTLKRAMYDPPRRAKRRAAPAAGKSILPAERHCPARGEPLPGVSEPTSPATGANPNGEIGK